MKTNQFKLSKVLKEVKNFESKEVLEALVSDIDLLQPLSYDDQGGYFNEVHGNFYNLLREHKFIDYIHEWETILFRIREFRPEAFASIHKGTPYYFCGVASFHIEDYERAVFYFDAALIEDRKKSKDWLTLPAALFLGLNTDKKEQFAYVMTERVEELTREALDKFNDAFKESYDLNGLKASFLSRSLSENNNGWRSAATALISFILEKENRRKEFKIRSAYGGTMEPFFIHLFKGCLLFETLLKLSPQWNGKSGATLRGILKDEEISNLLKIDDKCLIAEQSFEQVVANNKSWRKNGITSNNRVVGTVYGLRNTTGHNLAWESSLEVEDYMNISDDLLCAIFLVIFKLLTPP